jgi:hypothetical protein
MKTLTAYRKLKTDTDVLWKKFMQVTLNLIFNDVYTEKILSADSGPRNLELHQHYL